MPEKILVVEDEPSLRETLAYNLTRQGYDVNAVGDGEAAIEAARRYHPNLIILDLMLPILDGLDVCRILRREMTMPVIMLTARDSEIDRVLGLEMGADDYISKPFSMRELMARVKAQLRRVRLNTIDTSISINGVENKDVRLFDNLEIDPMRREVRLKGEILNVKPKEFELLECLTQNKGQVLSRELILDRVWGWDFTGGNRTVDVHIRWLREKIEVDPGNPTRIVTVRGIGYRFNG